MPLVIIMIFILYSVVIGWIWNYLGDIDKIKKILIIAGEMLVISLITLIVYTISKNGIDYTNKDVESSIKTVIVALFTGFNSLITLPFLNKQIIKLKEKEAEEKSIVKKVAIMFLIFIVCLIFECGYMKDTQKGILQVQKSNSYNHSSSKSQTCLEKNCDIERMLLCKKKK